MSSGGPRDWNRSGRVQHSRMSLRHRWRSVHGAAVPWSPPAKRTVVLAPHPDDETLSSGGLISFQRDRGVDVVVVAVTDGDASYDPAGDPALAATRRAEQQSALGVLGVDAGCIRRLGLPDSHVADFETDVGRRLGEVLRPDDLLVTTWSHDVHPDHEACGRAARAAAAQVPVTLLFSLFWSWHHRRAEDVAPHQLLSFDLDADVQRTKAHALRQHRSQFHVRGVSPILDERVVEPATWSSEYYLDARTRTTAKDRR